MYRQIKSIRALAMCFSMLVGTTLAWFTDSATSSGNVITTGRLEAKLYYAEGGEAVPTTDAGWTNADGIAIFNNDKWEPGYTEAKHLKIANEGTLAIKYQIAIIPNGEVSELADVIDVYYYADEATEISRDTLDSAKKIGSLADLINRGIRADYLDARTAHTITLVFKMQDTADDTYQGLKIGTSFDIRLLATQKTAEEDSFGADYDKNAWISGMWCYTAQDVAAALNAGEDVKLMNDITLDSPLVVPAAATLFSSRAVAPVTTINLNGKNISAISSKAIINEGSLEIVGDGAITSASSYALYNTGSAVIDGSEISSIYNAGALLIKEATVNNTRNGAHAIYHSGTELTIEDGVFTSTANNELLCAPGSNVTINGGSFTQLGKSYLVGPQNAGVVVKGGELNGYVNENGTNDAIRPGAIVVEGGEYNFAPDAWLDSRFESVENEDGSFGVKKGPAFKIGNATFYEEELASAIAAWTNGTTLTLTNDVTLSDVIVLKSTEHHILDLGTFTMTAAAKKNAIEITCNDRASASYALTVNADSENPGGINAPGKACIYYNKTTSTKDRPIILINNGVFEGSYSLNFNGKNGNTNCPQIWINGGIFNSYVNLTKCMLQIKGGVFHGSINCTGDTSAYRQITGGRFKSWQFMTADAIGKFFVGSYNQSTKVATYNVGIYVDAEGYLVVGGDVITNNDDGRFEAHTTNYTKGFSSCLKYSSAAEYGLYFESAEWAAKKVPASELTVFAN